MPSSKTTAAPTSRQLISRQLRTVILDRGTTAYALGKEAGVDPGVIQRFLNEERDIRLDTLDRLAEILGLRLVEGARGRGRPARSSKPATPTRTTRPARPVRQAGGEEEGDEGVVSGPRSDDPAGPQDDHVIGPIIAQVDQVSGPRWDEPANPRSNHDNGPSTAPQVGHVTGPTSTQDDEARGPKSEEPVDPAADDETRPAGEWWTTPADSAEVRPDQIAEPDRPIAADDPPIAAAPDLIIVASLT